MRVFARFLSGTGVSKAPELKVVNPFISCTRVHTNNIILSENSLHRRKCPHSSRRFQYDRSNFLRGP